MDWLGPTIRYLSLLPREYVVLFAFTIAYVVVRDLGRYVRRILFPRPRPPGPMTPSKVEQIKILATYLNTIGAGFMVTGVVGPIATYLYGTTKETDHSAAQLAIEIGGLMGLSVGAHFAARRVLRRLDP